MIQNIVFIDSRVTDRTTLTASLGADTAWFLIDEHSDGLVQMAAVLAGYSGLASVQIVSHGSAGTLQLGASVLDTDRLAGHGTELQAIGTSLRATGDLLLYGCEVGAGEVGAQFIETLAQLTGAEVAASLDRTGAAALGGDWLLEQSTGTIEATGAFAALAPDAYAAVLADDFAATTATTGIVLANGTATGAIEEIGDRDWFRVALTGGATYAVQLLGTPSGLGTLGDPLLEGLYDVAGNLVSGTFNDDSGGTTESLLMFTPTSSGTYHVAAGAFSAGLGSYQVRVTEIDVSAGIDTTAAIAVGGSVHNLIGAVGDVDWVRATLTAGQGYVIELNADPIALSPLADPLFLGLYDSAGVAIAGTSNDDNGTSLNSRATFTATADGTYYLAASGFGSAVGGYELRLYRTDDYAATIATTAVVGTGGALGGHIDTVGDVDWARTTLTAGVTYVIELNADVMAASPLVDPVFVGVHDAAGTLIPGTFNDDFGTGTNARMTFTPTSSGTYYLGARGFSSHTGDYQLRLSVADDHEASTLTAASVASGGSATGQIESAGDRDWFRATLSADTTYTLRLLGAPSAQGTLGDPVFDGIYDAAGAYIPGTGNDDFGATLESQVTFTPTTTGTYYLSAASFAAGTGSYRLSLTGLAVGDLAGDTTTTAAIVLGGTLRSQISPIGDIDWVRTTLTAGQTYVVELNADTTVANALLDPILHGIYGSTGALIAGTANDDYGIGLNSRTTYTATTTGTYYLAAGGFGGHVGAYELRLLSTSLGTDLAGQTPATAASLSVGTARVGAIDFARDVDWYAVTLNADQAYKITARGADGGAGTLADPQIAGIYDAAGQIIPGSGNNDVFGSLDAQTDFVPTRAGTYYIAVDAANDGTGTYTLAAEAIAPTQDLPANATTPALLQPGTPLSGAIEAAGDVDWIGLSLTAGTTYQIGLLGAATANGTLADPLISGVFSAGGAALALTSDDDGGVGLNAQIGFTADQTGTYYLSVGSFGAGTGTYQAVLTATGADTVAPTLQATSPADGATLVAPATNLSLNFNEAVHAGTGNITVVGGGTTRTIAVTDTSQVSFSGSSMTVNPTTDLAANTAYTVTFGAGVVRDLAGNAFAGITSSTQFNFSTAAPAALDSWTVMVYLAADNNLEGFGIDDLNEMESVVLPGNVNVSVLVDRAPGYNVSNGNWTDTRFGLITADTDLATVSSTLTSLGESNTGDGATLTDFINRSVTAAPASHYALIVWDHGGGLSGTSWDDTSGADNLTLPEFVTAVSASNVGHFDFIGFDACLQGMVEQAWDVRTLTDVLVASQELEPGDGWEYQTLLGALAANPNASSFDLGNAAVDAYGLRYAGEAGTTLSATRTSGLTDLKTAIDAFANASIAAGNGVTAALVSAATRATALHGGTDNYRDLGDFMREVVAAQPNAAITAAAQQVLSALDSAVLSQATTVAGVSGLSIYLPLAAIDASYDMQSYSFLQDTGWGNFLRFMLADGTANRLIGNASANDIRGFAGNDTIDGGAGNDTIDGGVGSDVLIGGLGNDIFTIDVATDLVTELVAQGTDLIQASISYSLIDTDGVGANGGNVENLRLLGSAALNATGNALANTLYANAGNNLLDGSTGTDTASYLYATAAVTVSLALAGAQATGGSGSDTLVAIENLTGSNFADRLTGNAAANALNGGVGADTMTGGDGSDTYTVDNVGDVVTEANALAAGGSDTVNSLLGAYTLGANVENGRILSTGAATLTGNTLANTLYAGAGANTLNGSTGVDTASYQFASAAVIVSLAFVGAQATSGSGSDTLIAIENLTGSNFADRLIGNTSANAINGGVGADAMLGGDGSDTYAVDNTLDQVIETNAVAATGGTDLVNESLAAYTLSVNVENGRILSTGAATLTGNTLANTLYAGAGANTLNGSTGTDTASYLYATAAVTVNLALAGAQATGGSGSDTLVAIENLTGSNFADRLTGNTAANALNGGVGADTMTGGDGSDSYTVDNALDVVTETNALAAGGSDLVNVSLASYTLGTNVENGRILSTGAATLTGNTLANTLYAGTGANTLDGSTGVDTASFLFATAAVAVNLGLVGAQATGGSGSDTLVAIERLTGSNFADTLTGDATANVLNGGAGADTLNGAAGNDTLIGGLGLDAFTGGAGADTFRFDSTLGVTNIDTLLDYSVLDDTLQLENALFTALTTTGTLAAASLRAGAGFTTAADANDFVIYDSTTGAMYYDADGSGLGAAAVRFATLSAGLALTNADFAVS